MAHHRDHGCSGRPRKALRSLVNVRGAILRLDLAQAQAGSPKGESDSLRSHELIDLSPDAERHGRLT